MLIAMGLDSYIRKIPKTKLFTHSNCDIRDIPGYYNASNEVLYWRNHRALNNWMIELSTKRSGPNAESMMNGAPIFLSEQDLVSLKLEMMFNSSFQDYWVNYFHGLYALEEANPVQTQLNKDISRVDHLIRVRRRNHSSVFYIASW
jgi:hypothetical protein